MKINAPTIKLSPSSKNLRRSAKAGKSVPFTDTFETPLISSSKEVMAPFELDGVDSLLSLQEIHAKDIPAEKLKEYGNELLKHLDNLLFALIEGAVPLKHLKTLLADLEKSPNDMMVSPHLIEIIEEIKLRAHVEIAKLEKATKMILW